MARYYGVPLRNGLPLGLGSVLSLRKPGGAAAAVPDPYFEYTTLLLPGNGTNGAQNNTFLDSSTNNFTITRNGNTTQGTFSPFSQTGWGNYFDGTSGQFLNAPANTAFNFGTGDFTVEGWVYPTSTSGTRPIVEIRTSAPNSTGFALLSQSGATTLNVYTNGGFAGASTGSLATNQWNHVALVRSGNTWTYYINGTSSGSFTNSSTQSDGGTTGPKIAGSTTAGEIWIGYISNIRIVKGTAVYTGNFTPSTTPLTAISGTSLLTCQSNRFADNSANAFAITVNGTPSVQAFSPFNPTAAWSALTNGGSAYFDGSGDYLTAPTNAAWAFGTGDFTIECWVNPSSQGGHGSGNNDCILDFRPGTGSGAYATLYIFSNGTGVYYYANGANRITGSAIPNNAWTHLVVSRVSSNTRLFINGVQSGATYVDATNYLQGTPWISQFNDVTGGGFFNGYITDMRVVKGSGVTSVTVPTSPLTAIANTQLLLNYTNAGIYDATSKNDLETVGNAQISTTQSKFGGSSMYFDGTGDWLAAPLTENLKFGTGDFTIEGWFYNSAAQQSASGIFSYLAGATYFVMHNNAGGYANKLSIWVDAYAGTPIIVGSTTLVQDTWYHFAISRASGVWRLFLNGTQEGSNYTNSAEPVPANSQLRIALGNNSGGFGGYTGYMDDFRVTKGYARYTANFTPPTSAFPLL